MDIVGLIVCICFMDIVAWAQEAVFIHTYIYIWHILDCLGQDMQVLYLGRAPRTKETLPDFSKVASGNPTSTCIPRVDG